MLIYFPSPLDSGKDESKGPGHRASGPYLPAYKLPKSPKSEYLVERDPPPWAPSSPREIGAASAAAPDPPSDDSSPSPPGLTTAEHPPGNRKERRKEEDEANHPHLDETLIRCDASTVALRTLCSHGLPRDSWMKWPVQQLWPQCNMQPHLGGVCLREW